MMRSWDGSKAGMEKDMFMNPSGVRGRGVMDGASVGDGGVMREERGWKGYRSRSGGNERVRLGTGRVRGAEGRVNDVGMCGRWVGSVV